MAYGEWVTLSDAQRLTGLPYFKLYRAVKRLGLETSKAGNTIMLRVQELDKLKKQPA
jgi:hypothetical protein